MSTWLQNLSISHRLIVIITSINLIIILLIGLIAVSSNRRALESQATRRFAEKNQQVVSGITTQLEAVMATALELQTTLSELQNYSQNQIRSVVKDIISQDNDILIHRVGVYRPPALDDGEAGDDSVVVLHIFEPRTGEVNETRTFSFDNQQPAPDAPMFTARDQNEPIWFIQEVAYQDTQYRGAVSLAVPYVFSSTEQGVIWLDIPQPVFDEMVTQQLNLIGLLSDTINGFTIVVDKNHEMINSYGEQSEAINTQVSSNLLATINSKTIIDNLNPVENPLTGEEDLAAVDIISMNGWQLVSVLPRADIPTPTGVLILQLVLVAIAGVCTTVIAVNYFVRRTIVEPLSNLSRVAQEIGSGDLRYHIDYRGYEDEIGFLARAMEGMKGNIANSYNELRNWSRTLEERVYERTKQLNATRREAEETANELQSIHDESLIVVNEPMLEPILDVFTQRILLLLNASYCSIWLLDDDRQKLRLATNTLDATIEDFWVDATQGMVGQSITKQEVIIVDDYSSYKNRVDLPYQTTIPYTRAMVAPLMFDGTPMGAVVVGRTAEGDPFTETNTRRLILFANLVSPAVRNAQLFNQREAARREAEKANIVKTRFLASVTHELRTPLNLIINNMDFMRIGAFGDVTDDQVSRLNQTVRSAEHLLYLINDLLDVSKIEAGEMQLFIQPNDVQTIVEDSIDTTYAFMEKIEDKSDKVQLILNINDDLPKIPMDARRIRQVLTNLLSNAVKFTREGEVELTVKAVDEGIYFAVRDTGMGVPESELSVLFEAFERTTQAKEQNIEGTGLGLPISQFLVQQHGGTLEVESVDGEGATFMFTLPYTSPDKPASTDTSMMKIISAD